MKKISLILFTFISIFSLTAQTSQIDSLKNLLGTGNNQQQLSVLEKLAFNNSIPANERIDFSERAIILAEKQKQEKSEAFARLCLGRAYNDSQDYLKSVISIQNAIVIYEKINDREGEAKGLSALGGTFFRLRNTDKSLECFEEALQIRIELGDENSISKSMMNLGSINAVLGNFEKSMDYFKRTLEIGIKNNNLTICSQCYNNIANIHIALGQMDKVLPYRLKALKIDRELKDEWQIAIKTYNLAEYFLMINEAEKAYPYIVESKELAEKLGDEDLINDNIEFLSWYYKLTNDYIKALEYLDQYAKANKKIFTKELSEKVSEAHVLYETEKKEREKQSIQLELERTQKDQILLQFSVALILLVCGFLIYIYYKKKRYNSLLKSEVLERTKDLKVKNEELTISSTQLKKAKEKAEESDRLKSAFLANMSHEIRTPMNGVLGFSELLKNPNLTGKEKQKYISLIEKSGARMLNIIGDIVSISKIESGQMEVSIQESNINDQIESIYTFFKPIVNEKGMQFSFKNPLSSKKSIVKTDQEKVYSILSNLIKNSIKYSETGSIEFGYIKKNNYLEFYVKDTGIGIPKDRQEAIFERFIQADIKDKMAYQGAGLGLAIAKAYIEILGGNIWVESTQGIGSTFYFSLPYLSEINKENITEKEIKSSENVAPINKLKILIVEDEETSAEYIKTIVQKLTREIICVKNGKAAVETCRKNLDIDIVLMDIQMPEMNGYEATQQIRIFNKEIIIIAQTAFALSGDREKAIIAGCNDYLPKPINKNLLLKTVKKYFG